MQCIFSIKCISNQRQSSLKQGRSYIVYWMWLVVASNIISHIIQLEATFCMTSKENPHCGLNVTAVNTVANPYNPYRNHTCKTWNQKPHDGLNVAFIIHPHNPDYLLLWFQTGLCGLFKPQIIQNEVTFNPHVITREWTKTRILIKIKRNKNYKSFSGKMEINTKKLLSLSQFLLNYENFWKFALLCQIMNHCKKLKHGNNL